MGTTVSPDGRHLYVTTGRSRALLTIDTATHSVVDAIDVGDRPWGVAVSPDGRWAYTANGPSNDVSAIDLRSRAVTKIKVGRGPWGAVLVSR